MCNDNLPFKDSLIVSLLYAAATKYKYGNSTASEEKVVNFYVFINTYNPTFTQAVLANLQGPSDFWIRRLNAMDKNEYIVDSGNNLDKIVSRMHVTISL